jgi:GNAT superfamily N-acetyltransferase
MSLGNTMYTLSQAGNARSETRTAAFTSVSGRNTILAGLRDLADLMGNAFLEHDNWKRVIPEADRRKRALTSLFYFMAAVVNRYGHIVVTMEAGRRVGYTTFMENRDREQVSFRRVFRCGELPRALTFLFALKPRELAAMRGFASAIDEFERANGHDTNGLHLYSTAVDPARKGQGMMKRSFAWAEARLKAAGFTSYSLETTDPANLPVYERFGLTLVDTVAIPGTDRNVWFLRKGLEAGASNVL